MAAEWPENSDRASIYSFQDVPAVGPAATSAPAPSGRRHLLADLASLAFIALVLALVVLLAAHT